MLYTTIQTNTYLTSSTHKNDITCLDITDFEHFTTEYAHDRLHSLPN